MLFAIGTEKLLSYYSISRPCYLRKYGFAAGILFNWLILDVR